MSYVFFVVRSLALLAHRYCGTLWVGGLWRALQAHVAGTIRVSAPAARCTALLLPLLYGKAWQTPFLPLCLSACGMVSHTDTVVEPSEVVANATGKDLPLNVGLVVVSEALPVPSCALARVPAVAHTRPAGALRQRYGPHRRSTPADPCWPSCRFGPSSRRRAPDVPPQQPGAGIPGAQARPDAPAKQPGRADRP